MNFKDKAEQLIEQHTKEVAKEGCQAAHDGDRCLHCGVSPCPHCKRWGGKQRIEKVFSITSEQFFKSLHQAHDEAVGECIRLLTTHTEQDGSWCDTGEDMGWGCRSECVSLAEKRLQSLLTNKE